MTWTDAQGDRGKNLLTALYRQPKVSPQRALNAFLQRGVNHVGFLVCVDNPRELELSSRCSLRLTALLQNAILQRCFIWH
ncbi:MAG: hypothetical protein ACYCSH_04050 [Acidithiobacillus sp.]